MTPTTQPTLSTPATGPAPAAPVAAAPVVRRLLVDLRTPPPRHWNGGDAFRTAWFNALSMSFPVGEQFFIDAVRAGLAALPPGQQARFQDEVRGFIGQEATHRHVHALFNDHLARQGLVNHWAPRVARRLDRLKTFNVRAWLGVTAATEHFTAILAEHLLRNPDQLVDADPRLRAMWLWHASEEAEHRSTAFDLYRALGGNQRWRLRLFYVVTWHFCLDALRQTLHNLWRDGSWCHARTWGQAWRYLFGGQGLVRALWAPWQDYRRADFHPAQRENAEAVAWLDQHGAIAPPLAAASGGAGPA
jgi:predicted metal-dependent hydrolase